jgi:O-antigen ligase
LTSRPGLPLIIAFITVCFAPLIEGGTTNTPVFILSLLVAVSVWLHFERWSKGGKPFYVRSPLDIPGLLFAAVAVFSMLVAPYTYMAMTWLRLITMYALFFIAARASLYGARSLLPACIVVISMGLLESVVSIAQWGMGVYRVRGTFFNPNMSAGYIAATVILAVSLLVSGKGQLRRPAARLALAAYCAAGLTAMVMSGSRGALAAFAVGLFVVLWLRYRFVAAGVVFAVILLMVVVPNPVKKRLFSKEPFAYSRTGIWTASVRMAGDHPAGVGLGNFKYIYPRYAFPVDDMIIRYGKEARTAHNEYLQFAAEMGIPGIAAMLALLYALLRSLYASVNSPASPEAYPIAAGVLGGVISVLTHSLVDSNMHEPGIVLMLILLVCVGLEAGAGHGGRVIGGGPAASVTRIKVMGAILAAAFVVWVTLPQAARYFMEKGQSCLKQGEFSTALDYTETALALDPGNAIYHEQKASALYALYDRTKNPDQLSGCLAGLAEAERLNPNSAVYPVRAATVKMSVEPSVLNPAAKKALVQSSAEDIGRALESEPFNAELLYRLAGLDYKLGDISDAEESLVKARDIEPNFLKGRYMLAVIYNRSGRERLSKKECYSIIGIHERLSKMRLSKAEAAFVAVDIAGVKALLASLEGANS